MEKALSFIDTTVGKKVVMALSGLVLFGFVIGHMLGNLQVLMGPERFNAYAVGMHALGPLLWLARLILLVAVALHISTALSLVASASAARPEPYRQKRNVRTSFAALTMKYSGVTLLFFILYHLAHFTFPGVAMGAYEHKHFSQAYSNLVNGFSIPWVVALYTVAMLALGLHLYHGAQSLLQTMGLGGPRLSEKAKFGAQVVALTVTVGNIMLPFSVLAGLVR